ncbi:MAG: hypothetical protein PHD10_02515 [Bacilli bacterium]|nr:hypothetical protein [Bacilli bacterium]MDD4607985.1 hypothetical protein [Bacilli bacterium]
MDNRLLKEKKLLEDTLEILNLKLNRHKGKAKRELKKEIRNLEKELNICTNKIYYNCSNSGHDYGAWKEHVWFESVYFVGFDQFFPTGVKNNLFYVRKCKICGHYEYAEHKPNDLIDKPKILQKRK